MSNKITISDLTNKLKNLGLDGFTKSDKVISILKEFQKYLSDIFEGYLIEKIEGRKAFYIFKEITKGRYKIRLDIDVWQTDINIFIDVILANGKEDEDLWKSELKKEFEFDANASVLNHLKSIEKLKEGTWKKD